MLHTTFKPRVLADVTALHSEILKCQGTCSNASQLRDRIIDLDERCRKYTEYSGKIPCELTLRSILMSMLDPDTAKMTNGYTSRYETYPGYKSAILKFLAETRVQKPKSALKAVGFNDPKEEGGDRQEEGDAAGGGAGGQQE
jgi:hypothetical protein